MPQENLINMSQRWTIQGSLDDDEFSNQRPSDEEEAMLRHDMVNCITSMHLQIELLRRKAVLDDIQSGALVQYLSRMEMLMNDWRQIKPSQAQYKTEAVFNLSEVVLKIVEGNRASVLLNEQSLTVYIDPSQALMTGNQSQIQRALDNLISNAMKYTPRGGAVLVSMMVEDGKAVIIIADTGMGIRADEQQYVFMPFYRGRNAIANEISGTGLGLSQVKEAVEQHGGSVSLYSKYGLGTQVNVYLPLKIMKRISVI